MCGTFGCSTSSGHRGDKSSATYWQSSLQFFIHQRLVGGVCFLLTSLLSLPHLFFFSLLLFLCLADPCRWLWRTTSTFSTSACSSRSTYSLLRMEKWVSWIVTPGRVTQRCTWGHFYKLCVCPAERQVFLATWKDIPNENELQYQIKECHLNAGRRSHFYSCACDTCFCLSIEQPDISFTSCTLNCNNFMLLATALQAKSYFLSIFLSLSIVTPSCLWTFPPFSLISPPVGRVLLLSSQTLSVFVTPDTNWLFSPLDHIHMFTDVISKHIFVRPLMLFICMQMRQSCICHSSLWM